MTSLFSESEGGLLFDIFSRFKIKKLGLNAHRKHNSRFDNNISEMVKITDRHSFSHK